ncbi:hypothetical protein AAG906_018130 [Vitis piasezkii]
MQCLMLASLKTDSKVACETCTKTGMVMVFGEITTKANIDYEKIVRDTCRTIGFVYDDVGFDVDNCKVLVNIGQQSPDITGCSRPDGKTQVTAKYHDENGAMVPLRVHTVLISTQHDETITNDEIPIDLKEHVIKPVIPEKYLHYYKNSLWCHYLRCHF